KENEIKQYKAVLYEAGFELLNKISKKYCTCHSTTRKSIIDHVSSNLKNNNFHMAIINSSLSDHKQIYTNKPQKDWINKDIIAGTNQRNYMWTEHKKNPEDESLETEFKTKRDRTAKLIRDTKNTNYYKEFTKCINKPKHMWNLINK
ncbi:putative tick transposon, partial [Operophtera brumata]